MRKIFLPLALAALCSMGTLAQTIKHPSLLFTQERIQEARKRVSEDSLMANGWQEIKQTADGLLKRNDIRKMYYLALAYQMTDSVQYADKLKSMLIDIATNTVSWGDSEMLARTPAWNSELQMAHKSFQVVLAYDAIYDRLTASERRVIAQGMKRIAIDPLLGDWVLEPTRIHSLNSMGHNWWTSCACIGGLLALSMQNELPEMREYVEAVREAVPQWFDFAGDALQHKPKSFDDGGGMYESINYARFGIQEALLFMIAWENAYGKIFDKIPQLSLLPDFFMHVCYPRTGQLWSINFGDSHKNVAAESCLMLLCHLKSYGAGKEDMSKILWYISQVEQGQHGEGFYVNRPMGFLYTPDFSKAPSVPTIGKSLLLKDFDWAMMRSSWEKDATMLAVKSGHTWNHSHADANSFILFHKGVDIIKDAGNCSYSKPEYRNYFFQSDAHNVVKFNGEGQSREQQYHGSQIRGEMDYLLDAGSVKYVLADGTGPMADKFSRNFRHFLWMDDVIYIIDDLKSHEIGHYEWLWHPGGEARKRGGDLTVTNGNSSVVIRPVYPRPLAQSDFVHDYPNDLYWEILEGPTENLQGTEKYYSFHLPAKTDRVKALTAVILKDTPEQKELPVFERREGKDWIGLRITNGSKITDLYINQLADGRLMHLNSWIEADGWSTDAYMFAVSYEKGAESADTKDVFLLYGSSLRRSSDIYFSSLAKLNYILQESNGKVIIELNGQPTAKASFRTHSAPSSVELNGKQTKVEYKGKMMKVTATD